MLEGSEETVYGDSGYTGAEKRKDAITENAEGKSIEYEINMRPSQIGRLDPEKREAAREEEHKKSSIRAKVEHIFGTVKARMGYRKTRYRGLRKQISKAHMIFALANLIRARRWYSTRLRG